MNVSPIQFRHNAFPAAVDRILEETGMDASRLELELTEGVVIKDADQAENAIIELRAKSVRLALDNFGIGYSSLIYLRRRQDQDRQIIPAVDEDDGRECDHSALNRASRPCIRPDRHRRGIENEDQRRFLQALGCHELQGFLFSQPLDADELTALIQQPRAAAQAVRQTQAA